VSYEIPANLGHSGGKQTVNAPSGSTVTPAAHGGASTLLVRGLNEDGVELDRVTLARKAQ